MLTSSGSLTQRIAYGAWGRFVHPATGTGTVSPTTIAASTTVTYTGHELIAGAGLINMGARLYDPATGLFMSPDPTVAHPYDTQDLNQYAYVGDNPETFTDPLGYSHSGGQPLCNAGQSAAPSGGGSVIAAEALNAGQAFATEASLKMWGGSTGLSEATALADVLDAFNTTVHTTIRSGIDDIQFYERSGIHGPSPDDSLINWRNLQVPWENYGAPQGAARTQAEALQIAIQAMCNFFQDANSESSSSSRGGSRGSGDRGGLGNGGGVAAGSIPLPTSNSDCVQSREYISYGKGPWEPYGPLVTTCVYP